MLDRSPELEQMATNKKGVDSMPPSFARRGGIRDEVPPSRVDSTANAKKGKVG